MMTVSERIYRLLLRLYPASYLHDYQEPMAQHFRDQLPSAPGILFWLRTLLDIAGTAPRLHWESALGPHKSPLTKPARRAVFFAAYEARSFAKPEITLEHLLLGLLRSQPELLSRAGGRAVFEQLVSRIEGPSKQRHIPAFVTADLALSTQCKRALSDAKTHARGPVTANHLVSAILSQESTLAARLLREIGIQG